MQSVTILSPSGLRSINFGGNERFPVIAGPCVVESEELLITVARELITLQERLPVAFVFKASYRKANRTSSTSFTGIGDEKALSLLTKIKKDFDLPILTDVHSPEECEMAAEVCDILQIPAFLSRQTELLHAAAKTGRVVNIKKAQFMSPYDMQFAKQKVLDAGNSNILMTERGTSFGYCDLVVDMRSLEIMKDFGSPIIYDATHSVQKPSQNGISGGERRFISALARAAVAVGVEGLFIETHPDPANAKSDAASQLPLNELGGLLEGLIRIREAIA
jgi:2-dehydro-3-deoxyphosphooctonate aldolase (KDO 8-P synthase)